MNKEQKAAVVEEVAAPDPGGGGGVRGRLPRHVGDPGGGAADAARRGRRELPGRQEPADRRAADKAGAESLKELLEGPTAFTFVRGDAALAAKAIATFRRENELLEFKGGTIGGEPVSIEQIESIARLPARDALARAVRGRARLADHRPGPRARIADPGPRAAARADRGAGAGGGGGPEASEQPASRRGAPDAAEAEEEGRAAAEPRRTPRRAGRRGRELGRGGRQRAPRTPHDEQRTPSEERREEKED